MAYATPHNTEHHRRPKNVFELEKHYSSPPIIFRRRSSHRSKCRSMSSFSTLSSNSTTSSSSLSSNYLEENHMFNKNIITNNINTNPITSSPSISFPSRIPFAWEKLPGIPKQQNQDSNKKLPLPPGVVTTGKTSSCNRQKNRDNNQAYSSKRYSMCSSEEMMGSFLEDPFFMAMVECSKDKNRRESTKMVATRTRSRGGRKSISSIVSSHLSDGIGMMNMYGSCKSSCTVSESSVVRLPSTTTYTETLFGRDRGRG
ncbi:hypothetical protein LIER_40371 [Lithospermum erythrorhizon]|uniref:Uncharacterized protein n=1 Tax=Lithospermum erythrorhizon TaxID=34254 RepID=A0AAV3QWR0_LITER